MIKWLARLIEPGNEWVAPRTSRGVQLAGRLLSTSSLRSGGQPGWTGPTMGRNKSQIQVKTATTERRVRRTHRGSVWMLLCLWARERDVPHRARGQWELILPLSYPPASLALLADRWWIHCFLKFVCNHRLYALLSYLSGPFPLFLIFIPHTLSRSLLLCHTLMYSSLLSSPPS